MYLGSYIHYTYIYIYTTQITPHALPLFILTKFLQEIKEIISQSTGRAGVGEFVAGVREFVTFGWA